MLTVLSILGVLAVLFVAAAVATREGPILADAPGDVADLGLPDGPLQPEDLQAVRFGLAVRGYRMAEVDAVLDRVAKELADRDRQLAASTARVDPTSVAVPIVVAQGTAEKPPVVPVEPPLDSPPPPAEEPLDAEAQEVVEATAPVDEIESAAPGEEDADTDAPDVDPAPHAPVTETASDTETSSDTEPAGGSEASEATDDVPPPEPPPVDVAVVRTEIAPIPDSAAAADSTDDDQV